VWIFIIFFLIENLPLSNEYSCLRNLDDRTVVGFIFDHTLSVYHQQVMKALLSVLDIALFGQVCQ
jgi:hypothetical protein